MEDKTVGAKKAYSKPMLETHEPLRNLTASVSDAPVDMSTTPYR